MKGIIFNRIEDFVGAECCELQLTLATTEAAT